MRDQTKTMRREVVLGKYKVIVSISWFSADSISFLDDTKYWLRSTLSRLSRLSFVLAHPEHPAPVLGES